MVESRAKGNEERSKGLKRVFRASESCSVTRYLNP